MLPSAGEQSEKEERADEASKAKTQDERPVVRPYLPDVVSEGMLLRRILPDAQLTVAQEALRKASHGRYEVRTVWTLSSADLNAYAGSSGSVGKPWPSLAQVSRIQRVVCQRDVNTGQWKLSEEVAYSITSLSADRADATGILKYWRAHWQIEALHWIRDVTYGEDSSQVYTGQAPEAFSVLRNAAATLVRLAGFPSIAAGMRELQTGPLGVLTLFSDLASRMRARLEAGQFSTSKPCPDSQGQNISHPEYLTTLGCLPLNK